MKVTVTQCEDVLKATFEDGNELTAGDPVVLGGRLRDLGVQPVDVTMPDWREGDIAPLTGSKIALLMALRGMKPLY
ncbi:hypothetical protein KOL96_01780 (plasmid) [Ralstonia wenshanensis]|uniref:Uncharacterized protein n=1 Tax=Ralstonia wenshanensis TaxID=2842456 RepID=A0AAD2BC32_9RALS|nr:hypothetical protein [Ralstonia wenshanensis]UGS89007.1 hypothetical protein KOL96_01780 [Ralstonia wenshanensis]CAJ0701734.1 hypothetical protein LMG18091_03508 [Ralstonia wenshanensis]